MCAMGRDTRPSSYEVFMSAKHIQERDAMQRLTDFLNEVGMLRHTPRSGYAFLGSGRETVAEHSHRTAVIGYVLAKKIGR